MISQNKQILAHLQREKSITPMEALHSYGCFRLAARIYELKDMGHDIGKIMIDTGSDRRVARYFLKASQ